MRKFIFLPLYILTHVFLFVNVFFADIAILRAAPHDPWTTSSRANSLRMGVHSHWDTVFNHLELNGPLDYNRRNEVNPRYGSPLNTQPHRTNIVPQRLQPGQPEPSESPSLDSAAVPLAPIPVKSLYGRTYYGNSFNEGVVYEGIVYEGIVYEGEIPGLQSDGHLVPSTAEKEIGNEQNDSHGKLPNLPMYLAPPRSTPLSSLPIDNNTLYQYNYLGQSPEEAGGQHVGSEHHSYSAYSCRRQPLQPLRLWADGYYNETDVDSNRNSSSYDISRGGVLLGATQPLGRHSAFGVMLGYSDPVLTQGNARWTANDFQIGLYGGTYIRHRYELKGFLGFGHQQYTMRRNIGNIPRAGRTNSDSFAMSFQLARPVRRPISGLWKPYIAIDLNNVDQDAFREYGPLFMHQYSKASYTRTFFRLGVQHEIENGCWKLRSGVSYSVRIAGDSAPETSGVYHTAWGPFASHDRGVGVGQDFFNANVGLERYLNTAKTKSLYFDYNVHLSNKETDYLVALGLKWIL